MFSSLAIKRSFWLFDIVLVVCIALLAVRVFNAVAAPPPNVHSPIAEGANRPPATKEMKPAEYYRAMSETEIFGSAGAGRGKAGAGDRPIAGSLASLPATILKLQLSGTTVGTPGMSSTVIENQTSKSVKVYKVGDKVAPGTVIESILPKKVILNREGSREVLALGGATSMTPSAAVTAPSGAIDRLPRVSTGSSGEKILQRREWMDRDPYEMMGTAKVAPAWKDGQVQGLELTNIAGNEYAERLGVRDGDIIVAVNGVKIKSLQDGIDLANRLQRAPVVTVEILRDGEPEVLTYKFR